MDAPEVRDWTCGCRQEYRVAARRGEVRFWPRSGPSGYSRHGLPAGALCVRCGRPLAGS
jgi:hypothetical protein